MLAAEPAVLVELKLLRGRPFVLRGGVVTLFALGAAEGDDISGHLFFLSNKLQPRLTLPTAKNRPSPASRRERDDRR
jgi:hypothetical protein